MSVTMSVTLNSGGVMPLIGFGTFKIKGKELVYKVLDAALAAGYRSIDTASVYRNEEDIGESLKELLPKYGLKRQDIFITSKLGPKDQGCGRCRQSCLQSLHSLQLDYLDLYLIHWPGTQGMQPGDARHRDLRLQSWSDMIKLQTEGKLKAIGVSNFLQHHIDDLIKATQHNPAVLQIEYHPHLIQRGLVDFCISKGIHFQAYSSLGTTTDHNTLLTDPVVSTIAKQRGVSLARVLLRWAVQRGIGVIPKSTDSDHIRDNMDIFSFSLSDEEMVSLDQLDTQSHLCWNPSQVL
ncbi:glyoxal reductase-like [Pecten maximus]|uniref:glyoxal reductase-like n=1 Tax=Pecten maximus TaxID=6579 RepID=UPI001458B175|nr:glyoxal reductase-like [Pecten maximus]XP_033762889.1 glyoxal reductase-like [Pecten maximus]XP_033762890.1 glyoxal reductase-like [Pecten maximus]XP_033762891.1 glyoxal reductase-like [Pecten maximus]XP_033762892.1 glyoxal reductase-like [Pecten maximus]